MDVLFSASSLLVMPAWVLMILLPRWSFTLKVMRSALIVLPIALLYAVLVVPVIPSALSSLMQPQLADIAAMLGTPEGATVGWIHFLAFDLFVGRFVFLDARERGISSWVVSPLLFLTLMFGPLGLATYLLLRMAWPTPTPATAQ
ncbi:MAG: DUF4281 domain-containing protein [Deltaproteobacteria bacterium]|nr:DUF4281 domain-containing protein [Deltaproteobacteria bacterium]